MLHFLDICISTLTVDLPLIISGNARKSLNINCRLKIHVCKPTDKEMLELNEGSDDCQTQYLVGTVLHIKPFLSCIFKELISSYRFLKWPFSVKVKIN